MATSQYLSMIIGLTVSLGLVRREGLLLVNAPLQVQLIYRCRLA